MEVRAITRNDCSNCNAEEQTWHQEDRAFDRRKDDEGEYETIIDRLITCKHCDSRALVRIDGDGVRTAGRIDYSEPDGDHNE